MTTDTLKKLREAALGFSGRFFYDAERGDLAYIAKDCDGRTCDCEQKLNSDGDQDCAIPIADLDDHVGEPMAEMLNAVPALLDEVDRLQADEATMKLSRMIGLGDPVRPDIHAKVCSERDSLRAQLAAMTAARDEACCLAEEYLYGRNTVVTPEREERIAALRKVGL